MNVFVLMLVLAILGLVTWAMVTYIPMPQGIKTLIIIVAVVYGFFYTMRAFGVGLPNLRVPTVATK